MPRAKVLRVTKLLAVTLASILPVLVIVVLHTLDTMAKRLGAIAGLTAAFSFSLQLFTGARLVDIFAATAAYV